MDISRLRREFPALRDDYAYLDNAASTQRPLAVLDAMDAIYRECYANVHRGIHRYSEATTEKFEAARADVQRFIHAASPSEIIFTSGCTASINLVARSWGDANVRAGDEILLTEMEHHSNIVPWHQLAQRTGCRIRFLPIDSAGLLRLDLLEEYLTPRVKLLAVTGLSNVLGTRNPLPQLVAAAHAVGALILVDAAQSVPHETTDVQQLDCDFLAISGHKMLGPTGIGVLYAKEALLDAMPPFLGGGGMISLVSTTGFECAELPAKFEAGTPPIVEAIGLGEAIRYLEAIGMAAIQAHEFELTRYAHERLRDVPGIAVLGPEPELKGGIVSFTLKGVHAHDIAQVLDHCGVAVRAGHHCTMPLHTRLNLTATSRASFYFYNTREEVDQLLVGLGEIKRKFRA